MPVWRNGYSISANEGGGMAMWHGEGENMAKRNRRKLMAAKHQWRENREMA
jgi:hypothetical protein